LTAIDVVIVTYQSEDHIEACLDAAHRLRRVGDVVVIDNDAHNRGFGAGQNLGVGRTSNDLILLLNPDAEVLPDAVERGVSLLESRPAVAAVQGAIVNTATGRPERSQGDALTAIHLVGRALGLRRLLQFRLLRAAFRHVPVLKDHVDRTPVNATEVGSLAATALLVRRAAFEQVGGFDERYFLYGEDLDLCRRLRNAGWRLVAMPDTWALHTSGASSSSTVDRERRWWGGTMQYAARWWSTPQFALALAAAVVAWLRVVVPRPSHARSAWSEMVTSATTVRRSTR
jgi:N-acetylglucosaminyl-diphospho-decaprenol L-rhamnosyltransferase